MTSKILILPYFGNFNNYFNLWLYSCKCNLSIDWLIITDNPSPHDLPGNVRWVNMSFQELKEKFQRKFDFEICLNTPYKLCDYKGFFGYLFSEDIKGYDFWGYCDCDLIFGNIANFLPEQIFQEYDKIFTKGHLSFVKNEYEINTNFKKYETYKIALTTPIIYGYDEAIDGYRKGFGGELLEQGYKVYSEKLPADINFRFFPFYLIDDKKDAYVFLFEQGRLFKVRKVHGTILKEEVIYVHLQKRKMDISEALNFERIIIYPNTISQYSEELLGNDAFWQTAMTDREGYYNLQKERIQNLKRDILRLSHEPNKIRCIVYRIKNLLRRLRV